MDPIKKGLESQEVFDLCHDLKTPLSAIMGMTTMAWTELEDTEKVKDRLAKIETTSNYLLSLVNDILDISVIINGRMTIRNDVFTLERIISFIEELNAPSFSKKNQTFEIKRINIIQNELIGDYLRINQIITNLLSNSMKYTGYGGKIVLELSQSHKTHNSVILQIKVEDSGIGMSKEFMARMFEPYSKGERKLENNCDSVGLGLYIIRNLVSLMGGEIKVTSKPGEGTTFIVSIPCGIPESSKEKEDFLFESDLPRGKELNFNPGAYNFEGACICLAEDNEDMQEIVSEILAKSGAQVLCFNNGLEILRAFEKSKENSIDAILMDYHMPVMGGVDAISKIRSSGHPNGETVPIIALTANDDPQGSVLLKESKTNAIIKKPVDFAFLFRILDNYINPQIHLNY